MSLPTCLVYSPGIDSGVELMGMPVPTLIHSTFKTIESGYHNCMFWEPIPNGFLCKECKFSFYFIQCAIENVGGENTKTISFKK